MKRILTFFFVTLGVIFFVLILAGTYFFITDPYELKPLFFGASESEGRTEMTSTTDDTAPSAEGDENPILNEQQEETLRTFGVDPAEVPSEISPEQERCFRDALGDERVDEIIGGGSPTPTEFFKARGCI